MAGRLYVDSVSRIPTHHNLSLIMTKMSTYRRRKAYNPFSEFFIDSSSSFHKLRWEFSTAGANKLSYTTTCKKSYVIFQSPGPRLDFFLGGTELSPKLLVIHYS